MKSYLSLLDSLGESDYEPCYNRTKSLFTVAKSDEVQALINPLIQAELTCNETNVEDNDDLCDLSDDSVNGIYDWIGKNIAYTDDVAKEICEKTPNACE